MKLKLYDGIPALTIQQPWATLIARGIKPTENRAWKPFRAMPFELAIHAGLRMDTQAIRRSPIDFSAVELPLGCIIAVCRVVDIVRVEDLPDDGWASGPWCWRLDRVTPIEPIFVRGHQGLWAYRQRVEYEVSE